MRRRVRRQVRGRDDAVRVAVAVLLLVTALLRVLGLPLLLLRANAKMQCFYPRVLLAESALTVDVTVFLQLQKLVRCLQGRPTRLIYA